ncbi:DUF4136 domain-containing protein [Sphingomonas mesophila]|uniref:DUF4136 domain-containing protein n=1 Tax=Sphingomonas mesophila TaxID=2303576 RepID=UPI000E575BEA|nr:DUF4136 domain-containing protein [Sphingomonas mesophila]
MRINTFAAAALLGASALGLGGCATGFPAQVSRYQAMPAPQGQTFFVVPTDPAQQGSLEFQRFGALVAQAMQAQGYQPASTPTAATMIVRMDYGVDDGETVLVRDPFSRSMYADPFYNGRYDPFYRGYYGRPYYSRYGGYYGGRSPYYYGWNDPYWYSPYGGVNTYTRYQSFLTLDIRRAGDNQQLFGGRAEARSTSGNLGILVPNLVGAMFTGFPGRSGETIRITVPPAQRR